LYDEEDEKEEKHCYYLICVCSIEWILSDY